MVLKRYVHGAEGEFFFQKRAPKKRPDWVKTVQLVFPSGRIAAELVVANLAQLAWIINLGCIDLNPHPVRFDDLDHPDELRRAALALAREVERRAPDLVTSKWWKEERHGVFIDYNQNAKDRTVASAYSVRPAPSNRSNQSAATSRSLVAGVR